MKKKGTTDVGPWWKIVEIHDDERNSKMVSFGRKEKVHWMLVNDEILLKFTMVREILKWSHFDEKKRYIGCWSMRKVVEIHHDEKNSKVI